MPYQHQTGSTVGAVTLRALRRFPGRTAFTWGSGTVEERLTYDQVLDVIGRTQAVLAEAGLTRGDRIAILSGNKVDAWCTSTAASASGIVVTNLHPLGSLADQAYQVQDAGATALFVDPGKYEQRGREIADATGLSTVFSFGPSGEGADLRKACDRIGASRAIDVADPAELTIINYTGGTTGRPKGVERRHEAVLSGTRSVLTDFEFPDVPRYLAAAPITHVAGTKILPTLHKGGTVHLLDGFSTTTVLTAIAEQRINLALLVPTMIYALLDDPALDSADLSSLEVMLYGASAMSPSRLREGHERLGSIFAQLYGQTECYPISYLSRADHARGLAEDPGLLTSCGYPVVGTAVTLLGADGEPVPTGDSGEICVRSQGTMDRYHDLPDLTEETLAGGWVHTGDIGRFDESGYLSIVDRKKDMIVSGGFNVFPREVEDALTSHPEVSTAAVYGVPDEKWGEAVHAAVVLKDGATVEAEMLIDRVKELKGSVQAPKQVRVLTELPTTAVGKVDKKALREE
ncbi:AMP-binding protein [Nocardioides insulae]|uniref:AMP-binding protein n=1 Tax=Nocardioides insulae TaxID=394734 RepID=UPI000423A711|nr:AMP-binding protein [Nocardioides insulae]